MASFTAIYDACVLYPAPLRDLLLRVAQTDLFRARWSDDIHDEWVRSVLTDRSDLKPEQVARTRSLMNSAVPDCLVTGYQGMIAQLDLPDPNDRHVLAAAIRCQAGVIVTFNLKDFPAQKLDPYGIQAQHPDDFLTHLIDLSSSAVCAAVRDQRAALKNPPYSVRQLLDTFLTFGLAGTVAALEPMALLL